MTREPDEALEVLRAVWSAQGQTSVDLDEAGGHGKSCKRMADVGFGDLGGGEEDLRAAWRARLEREGKLSPGGSVRDLVLGGTGGTGRPGQRDGAGGQDGRDGAGQAGRPDRAAS